MIYAPAPSDLQPTDQVTDVWRIDDEWWREHRIARVYLRVERAGGITRTLYYDLADETWHEQRYGPVRRKPRHVKKRRPKKQAELTPVGPAKVQQLVG